MNIHSLLDDQDLDSDRSSELQVDLVIDFSE